MARIPPPWEQKPTEPTVEDAPTPGRTKTGQFAAGHSGYSPGRPKGALSKRTLLARQFEEGIDDIVLVVKQKARDGDLQAAGLVLARALPPKRAVAERVEFDLDTTRPVHEQANQVVAAVAAGEIDSDAAKVLLDVLTASAALRKFVDFQEQLDALQAHIAQLTRNAGGQGGVVTEPVDDLPGAPVFPGD